MNPRLVGIVNLTEDSFSDGGRYLDPDRALQHAKQLRSDGADVIDLGAASSHPDAQTVAPREEIRRLEPVVQALLADAVPISVDSFRSETQAWALERGVDYLNDIHCFGDAALYARLARSSCKLIVMHSIQTRGIAVRRTTDPAEVWDGVVAFFDTRLSELEAAGIDPARLVLDPGMGFFLGANAESSLHVLRKLPELRQRFGRPLLVSVSRKSFLGTITGRGPSGRGAATLAAELFAIAQGADLIRTHDVRALRDALQVSQRLAGK